VRAHFRPEFWNRIDHVIPFRALSPADIRRVVELEVAKVVQRVGFVRRRLRLRVSAEARDLLARLGWHATRGARPLKRVLEERVVAPIAVLVAEDPALVDREIEVVVAKGDPGGSGIWSSPRTGGALVLELRDDTERLA
jgi:ATP-dependent Clp protease ATP-binding subunit ClpC